MRAQDTTALDFNGQAIAGLGPLSYETQRGLHLRKDKKARPVHQQARATRAAERHGVRGAAPVRAGAGKSWVSCVEWDAYEGVEGVEAEEISRRSRILAVT